MRAGNLDGLTAGGLTAGFAATGGRAAAGHTGRFAARWSCSRWFLTAVGGSRAGSSWTHSPWSCSRADSAGSSTNGSLCQWWRVDSGSELGFSDSEGSSCPWAFIPWTPNVGTNSQDFLVVIYVMVVVLDNCHGGSCFLSVL